MNKPYYLAGPMTGFPYENIPLFIEAAEELRGNGYNIVTPVELDDPESTEQVLDDPTGKLTVGDLTGETWGDLLARDVKLIADGVNGIVLLPGWFNSKGARLECFVALIAGYPVFDYLEGGKLLPVPPQVALEMITARAIPYE